MGQPSNALMQRIGFNQLWVQTPLLAFRERGFAEHNYYLQLGARLILLFIQSLGFATHVNLWGWWGYRLGENLRVRAAWVKYAFSLPRFDKRVV
jgi:hypothetical protein